ncbi:MAG: hypothetical protein QME96_06110 [Myxococcota bacterium]|nr:hypothetical protein [Myxococcota bacterium]
MKVLVECYAGSRADERPTAVVLEGARRTVEDVIDTWYGEDHLYFRVRLVGGDCLLVRRDAAGKWSLVRFDAA